MHQGLDPEALPWGHFKGDSSSPTKSTSQPLFVSRFLPMSGGSLKHNIPFLKTTDHSNASKCRKHDLETRYL
jgi:hypothetical protein